MIVDTSALVAILFRETSYEALRDAILIDGGRLPVPALIEFERVATGRGRYRNPAAEEMMRDLIPASLEVEPLMPGDAEIAAAANLDYGRGNGKGGTLNLLDLMVYSVARRCGEPILCTGRDFRSTDADIHLASRAT